MSDHPGRFSRYLPPKVRRSDHWAATVDAYRAFRLHGVRRQLLIDHPPSMQSRWGHSMPTHAGLAELIDPSCSHALDRLRMHVDADLVGRIPVLAGRQDLPHWDSGWISRLDAAILLSVVGDVRPTRIVEIGSGISTRFLRFASEHFGLDAHLTSIDPRPRAEIDGLCDRVLRQPLERLEGDPFHELGPGDVVYFDGSHRALTDSDVVVFFLEVLPRLAPGVVVHVHDVFLPDDYPPDWEDRAYSEQYLLAAVLLSARPRVLAGGHRLSTLRAAQLEEWWSTIGGPATAIPVHDNSFWFETS